MPDLQSVDPYDVNVSDYNERTERLNLGDLEESVREQGVIQPVILRRRQNGEKVPYEVVIGQRRTMAAQRTDQDEIPAVVVDWDDAEALEKSITENVDAFREHVGKKDRAKAIERLKDMKQWTNNDIADSLGVDKSTVSGWLEYTKDEWEGTSIHAENDDNESLGAQTEPDPRVVSEARQMTGGGEEGEEVIEEATELDLSEKDIREARKLTENDDKEPVKAVQEVAEDKAKKQLGRVKVRSSVTFTGNRAEAVQRMAEERGTTENKIVEQAVENYLGSEGYL